jgi:hypothetical protein
MYELETSWLLRALVDDHHDIDFARLARLPTLIGPPNSAQQFHPTPSHGSSSASTHARGIHACTERFLASLPAHRYHRVTHQTACD